MSQLSLLIVDDDREILQMTELLVRSAGYQVRVAGSGEEALLMVEADRPDLVLLDINMPGMDGWETLRILKEDERSATMPVVMFSVNFEVREKLRALQQGARDYITKPFETGALLQRLSELIGTPQTEPR